MQDKPVYAIVESTLFMGGFKIKLDGNTCAQFPTLDGAKNYLVKILAKNKEYYKKVDFIDKDGISEKIIIFE